MTDQPTFEYDESGKITGYKTKIGGADTVFPFSGGDAELKLVSGIASASPVSVSFIPSQNTSQIIIGGRRYGGSFTASIKDENSQIIASVSITASADFSGKNFVSEVTLLKVRCNLIKNKRYTLNIPAPGSSYAYFAFVIYP